MLKAIKKSASIVIDNPILTLTFVIYLIFLTLVSPRLAFCKNIVLCGIIFICSLLFSAAFFSGWLQMIKTSIKNHKSGEKDEEERVKEFAELKNSFFEAIPVYILPLLAIMVLYFLMLCTLIAINVKFANHFIGKLDFLAELGTKYIPQGGEALTNFLMNLPQEKLMIIYGWEILFDITICIFNFLLMFWLSALYYPKKGRHNPLRALKNSICAIFKHPLRTFGLYLFILILGFIFKVMGIIFASNSILYFILMMFGIYLLVFVFVLIFDYYEFSYYSSNCDNGCNSVGENDTCN